MAKSATDTARLYLEGVVARAREAGVSRLPPIKQMARDAGVANALISRAVKELVGQNVLDARPSRGITVVGARGEADAGGDQASTRWMRLVARFSIDCQDGIYGHAQQLPSLKELSGRYLTSAATMRKVLLHLESTGMLVAVKRGFRLPSKAPAGNRDTVVLLARANEAGDLATYSPRDEQYLHAVEQICIARDVRLRIVPCLYVQEDTTEYGTLNRLYTKVPDAQRVMGYLVFQNNLIRAAMQIILGQLVETRKPIALFSENSGPMFTSSSLGASQLRCFATETDSEAGRAVGNYLISHGHRRVCYFAYCAETGWEKDRLRGLRGAFSEHGIEQGVSACSAVSAQRQQDLLESPQEDNSRIADAISAIARERGIRYRVNKLKDLAYTVVNSSIQAERAHQSLVPHMRRTLKEQPITAWVGSNDARATECHLFLREHQAAGMPRIMVVGFDDSSLAASQSMTSYSFNGIAAINRMVEYVLRPNSPPVKVKADQPVVVRGFVHERATASEHPLPFTLPHLRI
jgi:DNA-binding LacI/PurR family transcriptional regulator/DNA-binding transcriptional regulator YhcF (GntR family)